MSGFAIYSSDAEPNRLHSEGPLVQDADGRVRGVVRAGDSPLDLLVDVGQRRVIWSFKGEHRTRATRTGYFVADYRADGQDLFRGLEGQLRDLHESDAWSLPHAEDLRWDTGFQLWRIDGDLGDASTAERDRLFAHLADRSPEDPPLEFATADYRRALEVLKAVYEADVDCTVAVSADADVSSLPDVDLVLRPGMGTDLEPLSGGAEAIVDEKSERDRTAAPTEVTTGRSRADRSGLAVRLAGAALLVVLGFSVYSFVSIDPLHPITGLSTIGGLLGSLLVFPGMAHRLRTADTDRGHVAATRHALRHEGNRSLVVVSLATLAAFLFPTIFRVGGAMLTGEQWLLGVVAAPVGAAASVAAYVGAMLVVSTALAALLRRGEGTLTVRRVGLLVGAHAVYALALLVANGLAQDVWYSVVPSV